jgi:hypothetical protein
MKSSHELFVKVSNKSDYNPNPVYSHTYLRDSVIIILNKYGDYKEYGPLGCSIVYFGQRPKFRRTITSPSSRSKSKLSKRMWLGEPLGVFPNQTATQTAVEFIVTAVTTSNPVRGRLF